MATHARSRKASVSSDSREDAIAALMADHKRVKTLFKKFHSLKEDGSEEEKSELVKQICTELTVHATIEEEIFYPAVREQIEDEDLMDEALVEHAGAKSLIAELEGMEPGDDLYDAKVTVLGEQIEHHVEEEEGEMFKKAKKAKVDTAALGEQMEQRRRELKAEMGADGGDAELESPRSARVASGRRRESERAGVRRS
jgi:hemerythrin superfamily protein